jgi:hypothetical protein
MQTTSKLSFPYGGVTFFKFLSGAASYISLDHQLGRLSSVTVAIVLSDGTRRFALPTLRARAVALPPAN